MNVKFKNGNTIESLSSHKNIRSKRGEYYLNGLKENPYDYIIKYMCQDLKLYQKMLLKILLKGNNIKLQCCRRRLNK